MLIDIPFSTETFDLLYAHHAAGSAGIISSPTTKPAWSLSHHPSPGMAGRKSLIRPYGLDSCHEE